MHACLHKVTAALQQLGVPDYNHCPYPKADRQLGMYKRSRDCCPDLRTSDMLTMPTAAHKRRDGYTVSTAQQRQPYIA